MAKFNVVTKQMKAKIAERKRAAHGDPKTGKLKQKPQPIAISGKRQRKLLKKRRRDQKEAIEKGLVNMEDFEMADASQDSSKNPNKTPRSFKMNKKLKLNLQKKKGAKKQSLKASVDPKADAMVE